MSRFGALRGRLAAAATSVICVSCGPGQAVRPPDPDVVASFRGGVVTIAELDRAIRALPNDQRSLAADEARERDRELVRALAVEELLVSRAESENIRQLPGFRLIHDENRQRVVADFFIERELVDLPRVGDDDVEAYFSEHADEFRQSERRQTLNLFRRIGAADEIPAAVEELRGLRERVLQGESFGALAREHSDSESASRSGTLGWLDRDKLPEDLATVIFALEPGVPSEPVVTADGVHLFLVTSTAAARDYTLSEVGSRIAALLSTQHRRQLVERLVEDLDPPDPFLVAGADELGALLEAGDPAAEVFQVGETSMHLARFRELVARFAATQREPASPELAMRLLEALAQRARIYEHCRSAGWLDDPELERRLGETESADLVQFMRERVLREEAMRDAETLEGYYEANKHRFSSPLVFDVNVLVVPIPDDETNPVMNRLAGLDADSAEDRLERAAVDFGGEVHRIEQATLAQLQRWASKVALVVSSLDVGRCSMPVRLGDSVIVVELAGRTEPAPQPLTAVADRVARSYVDDHRQTLYSQWAERALDDAGFHLIDERLEAYWSIGRTGAGAVGDRNLEATDP